MAARQFPTEISKKLGLYVYRLVDPRSGETFYVGRGRGNRVFSHANSELKVVGADLKSSRIHQIRLAGFEVSHVIHRSGLSEESAREVESALIDAYPGLTNDIRGFDTDRGVVHVEELMRTFTAIEAIFSHRILLISINQSAATRSYYEAVRYAWRLKLDHVLEAEYVLAVRQGLIVEAFKPKRWLQATSKNFPGRESMPDRYGFTGSVAPEAIRDLYVGRRVPNAFRRPGSSNPVRYSW